MPKTIQKTDASVGIEVLSLQSKLSKCPLTERAFESVYGRAAIPVLIEMGVIKEEKKRDKKQQKYSKSKPLPSEPEGSHRATKAGGVDGEADDFWNLLDEGR